MSNLEKIRKSGKTQVDAQRVAILDAAERVFLRNGLGNTRLIDIAAEAGITKMSIYRYFPNCDEIALEIQARMIDKFESMIPLEGPVETLEHTRRVVRLMIQNFHSLRDAYRFMGMFDSIYMDCPSDAPLSHWIKEKLPSLLNYQIRPEEGSQDSLMINQITLARSTTIWFLEKLAMRGEITWSDPATPLECHLELFEELIIGYIDRVMKHA